MQMLRELHEWLAGYGFALIGVSFILAIAPRAFRHRRLLRESSSFMAELRKRYPHAEQARAWEEIEIECRPSDARAWGRLRARVEERGLELRSRSSVVGWTRAGWRTLIPWEQLRPARQKLRGRRVMEVGAVGCSAGTLWVDDGSALRLVRHAGGMPSASTNKR